MTLDFSLGLELARILVEIDLSKDQRADTKDAPPARSLAHGTQLRDSRQEGTMRYRGIVGPSTPWNGVHEKILGAMSSR